MRSLGASDIRTHITQSFINLAMSMYKIHKDLCQEHLRSEVLLWRFLDIVWLEAILGASEAQFEDSLSRQRYDIC